MTNRWRLPIKFGLVCLLSIWTLWIVLTLANPIVNQHAFSQDRGNGTTWISDFLTFYQAGFMALSPQRMHVYDQSTQIEFTNSLIYPNHTDHEFFIQGTPFYFPLMSPLGLLSLPQAYALWYGLSLLLGLLCLCLVLKERKNFSKLDQVIILAMVLSSAPSVVTLRIGQASWLLLSFLCLLHLALKHQYNLLGGLSISLLTVKFQYMPLFATALISLRRWKLIATAISILVLLLLAAGNTIGWHNIYSYPSILFQAETVHKNINVHPESMVSLRGLLTCFFSQAQVMWISTGLLTVALIGAYKLWQLTAQQRISIEWSVALTTVASLVFSPHSHIYDLLLLALPAVLTLPSLSPVSINKIADPWLRIWSWLLLIYPVLSWFLFLSELPMLFIFPNLILLAAGILHIRASLFVRNSTSQ
jgi:hypothetical protein